MKYSSSKYKKYPSEIHSVDTKTNVKLYRENRENNYRVFYIFIPNKFLTEQESRGNNLASKILNHWVSTALNVLFVENPLTTKDYLILKTKPLFLLAHALYDERVVADLNKLYQPIFDMLAESGYKDAYTGGKTSSRYSRLKKKSYYVPEGEHELLKECGNGINIYIEKGETGELFMSIAIDEKITKIPYSDFKKFKDEITAIGLDYSNFIYRPEKQYFISKSLEKYSTYTSVKVFKNKIDYTVNQICEISEKYYPITGKQPAGKEDERQNILEQIEATKITMQYTTNETEKENLQEYLDALELTLNYI